MSDECPDLKPCPACGYVAELVYRDDVRPGAAYVRCAVCELSIVLHRDAWAAAEEWNHQPLVEDLRARLAAAEQRAAEVEGERDEARRDADGWRSQAQHAAAVIDRVRAVGDFLTVQGRDPYALNQETNGDQACRDAAERVRAALVG